MSLNPESFIGSNLRINLVDDRLLDGILTVIDPFGNILLSNAWETSIDKLNSANKNRRDLGLVSVPRKSILNISIDQKTHKSIFKDYKPTECIE